MFLGLVHNKMFPRPIIRKVFVFMVTIINKDILNTIHRFS